MKFSGVTILQGAEFSIFPIDFEWALQQCSATALPVIRGPWVHSSHPPNRISIGSAVFAGLTNVTSRQTDIPTHRQRYSICSNSPHLAIAVMQPNNHIKCNTCIKDSLTTTFFSRRQRAINAWNFLPENTWFHFAFNNEVNFSRFLRRLYVHRIVYCVLSI